MFDLQLWALGLFSVIAIFGGPEMMRQADQFESFGLHKAAAVFRKLAWVTIGLSPILAVILLRGIV
jgi:hypothetical protein